MSTSAPNPHDTLRSVFRFAEFRLGQAQVIDALLAGRPALAIFPTGGGKSLCYQLPALLMPGLTLVVSPLIALMKDQVDQLHRLGVAAAKLDSSVPYEDARAIYQRMEAGTLKLLYVAPERLSNEGFAARLRRTHLAMLAIDEAHCISEWGHNFRPDYLKIAAFAREIGVRTVLALTATATPAVAADVRRAFQIAQADHVQTGFHRPNLTLRVHRCRAEDRIGRLSERLTEQSGGPTIVYVTLQKTAERVAHELERAELPGQRVAVYHAGLQQDRRTQVQDAFMAGEVTIVVATIAFGMGIDKADIRAVYHYNLPKSLEGYSQEIGRAGRDGAPSRCELLAAADDQVVLDNFSYGDTPTDTALHGLVSELFAGGASFSVSRYQLSRDHDIRPLVVATVLTYLELEGLLRATGPFYAGYKIQFNTPQDTICARYNAERSTFLRDVFAAGSMGRAWLALEPDVVAAQLKQPRERIIAAVNYLEQQGDVVVKPSGLRHGYKRLVDRPVADVVAELTEQFATRESKDIERTARVVAFAQLDTCLTQALVGYFGEVLAGPCGHCGPCLGEQAGVKLQRRILDVTRDPQAKRLVAEVAAERHPVLTHPRSLARFLCGLRSPALQGRGGLQNDRRFGRLGRVPFEQVLELAEAALTHHVAASRQQP